MVDYVGLSQDFDEVQEEQNFVNEVYGTVPTMYRGFVFVIVNHLCDELTALVDLDPW